MGAPAIIHVIAGPTASGKSALALDMAVQQGGVVINADSMQVYGALPVLTAQPGPEDKKIAPHILYGVLHPDEACSAGRWRAMAAGEIEKILAAGQAPIIVGGSGLYIKALIDGFSPIPNVPDDVRAKAIARQTELGNPAFHAELQSRDPVMAARFHPSHTARLVRAWEVLEATGKSLSEWQAMPKQTPPAHWRFDVTCVMPDRDTLNARCDGRFDSMMRSGVMEEIQGFADDLDAGRISAGALINKALGARSLLSYLKGALGKDEAVAAAKLETRQYAKRQMTWFRHQLRADRTVV